MEPSIYGLRFDSVDVGFRRLQTDSYAMQNDLGVT
jgi:hypothetical protein